MAQLHMARQQEGYRNAMMSSRNTTSEMSYRNMMQEVSHNPSSMQRQVSSNVANQPQQSEYEPIPLAQEDHTQQEPSQNQEEEHNQGIQ